MPSLTNQQKGRLRTYYAPAGLKPCYTCGNMLRLEKFSKKRGSPDGLNSICKSCCLRREHERFNAKRETILSYRAKYRAENSKELARKKRAYKRNNPHKIKAKSAVQEEIIRGRMIRPSTCSKCGADCKPDGHHADYDKPLDVTWLCRRCHLREHSKMKGN